MSSTFFRKILKLRSNKITPIIFSKTNKKYNNECPICLDKLFDNEANLPCGHIYHSKCILDWFDKKMSCPVCKMKIQWNLVKLPHNYSITD